MEKSKFKTWWPLLMLLFPFVFVGILFVYFQYWPVWDIREHITAKHFNGDKQKHNSYVQHGRVKYCSKYIAILPDEFGGSTKYVNAVTGRQTCGRIDRINKCPPKDLGVCPKFCNTLHCAIRVADYDWLDNYTKGGGSLNTPLNLYNKPLPLRLARSAQMVEYLILNGASVNARDGNGNTFLFLKAKANHTSTKYQDSTLQIIEALIKQGADLSLKYGEEQLTVAEWVSINKPEKYEIQAAYKKRLLKVLKSE